MCKRNVPRILLYTHIIVWALLSVFLGILIPLTSLAQQPTSAAPLAPGEFVASKAEDIVGLWQTRFCARVAYMQYNADGTSILASTLEALENNYGMHGTFWVEGTILHVKDSHGQETYEIRVKTEGDQRVHLSFQVINDSVRTRVRDLTAGMPRFEPALKTP